MSGHAPGEDDLENESATGPPLERWSGIIGTGQSLGTGVASNISSPTPAAPHAFRLEDPSGEWDRSSVVGGALEIAPLTEPFRTLRKPSRDQYPFNISGKTPHSSMAAQMCAMAVADGATAPPTTIHTAVGIPGAAMDRIRKGGSGNAYEASLFEARAFTSLAQGRARLEYDCVLLTHGESDAVLNNHEYAAQLLRLHADYSADLRALTHQQRDPVLLLSQQNAVPWSNDTAAAFSPVIQAQWRAPHLAPSGAVVCAGPKYAYFYPDGLHLAAPGYDRLGEKYGQALYHTRARGTPFKPLSPLSIRVAPGSATLHVSFAVPAPPLTWAPHLPARHQTGEFAAWARGRGFEVRDAAGQPLAIAAARLGDDGASVQLDVDGAAGAGPPHVVAYAMSADADGSHGRAGGRGGQLCDSDATASAGAETLACWVQRGATRVQAVAAGAFARRALYDTVQPGGHRVVGFDGDEPASAVELGAPWEGESGRARLTFGHDMANYCVAFFGVVGAEDPWAEAERWVKEEGVFG